MAALVAALLLASGGPVRAATINVTPVRLVLTPDAPLGSFTVINEGAEPTRVQLTMNSWRQTGGQDVLTPTRDVLVNPTIFEVPGNSRQLIRLGLQVPRDKIERSYRLFIDEIPTAAQLRAGTIGVRLRIVVPLFVPVDGAKPVLAWRASLKGPEIAFNVANSGGKHSQILSIKATKADGKVVLDTRTSLYVLPNAANIGTLKPSAPVKAGDELRIEAKTDSGDVSATLRVEGS